VLERDRYEGKTNFGGSAGGDWPALHWAGIQASGHTFAIFNAGTPSYRVEDGAVTVSILRSPQLPYGLMEPEGGYVAHNYYGMTDHGIHHFRHALYIAAGDWRDNDTVHQAAVFNTGMQVQPGELRGALPHWRLDARHTQIAAIKTAEDGNGLIVHLVEHSGRPETVRLTPPPQFTRAQLTNLLEEPLAELPREGEAFCITMGPWKIVTARLTSAPKGGG
jgi:alpha-mannosidase